MALVTFVVFLPALQNDFVAWDDDRNFLQNTGFRGLGLTELRWMWTTFHLGHYVPLSWMTLGLDYTVWGMNPVGYHLTNLALHACNAALVYLIARRLFALTMDEHDAPHAASAAALAALLFSVHPLRVESVAWATERRDVLSYFFFLLSILSYLRFVAGRAAKDYATAVVACVAALLSKGTAVTLPAILLLLNVYPLRRLGGVSGWWTPSARRVLRELAPFFLLAMAAATMTLVALQHLEQLGPGDKLTVSTFSLAFYVLKTVAPIDLSPLYTMPAEVDLSAPRYLISYAAIVLAGAAMWRYRHRFPGGVAAAIAFFVLVFPLLGFVQNGPQIAADRYTYYAAPALTLMAAWMLTHLLKPSLVPAVSVAALALLAVLSWQQIHVWHDSASLWSRVLHVEPDSPIGHNNWGNVLMQRGTANDAITEYERAITLSPRYAEAHNNLGVALTRVGRAGEAVDHYRRALAIDPRYADAQNNWGIAAVQQGDASGAMEHYRLSLAINPSNADAHTNWGNALVRLGRPAEAVRHYEEAVGLKPDHADAHLNWGVALARQGKLTEAIGQFRLALSINPNSVEAKEYLERAMEMTSKP